MFFSFSKSSRKFFIGKTYIFHTQNRYFSCVFLLSIYRRGIFSANIRCVENIHFRLNLAGGTESITDSFGRNTGDQHQIAKENHRTAGLLLLADVDNLPLFFPLVDIMLIVYCVQADHAADNVWVEITPLNQINNVHICDPFLRKNSRRRPPEILLILL